jgi:hypothetical protein
MSLTSYRAAPPRVEIVGKTASTGSCPARGVYVAIVTRLEKPAGAGFVAISA